MGETKLIREIQLLATRLHARLFRNNTGKIQSIDGRWHVFGLCVGSSDLIGWTPVTVTADMVGKRIAIFTAIEGKSDAGRVSPEQNNFIAAVRRDGGLAGIARDLPTAEKILANSL